MPNALLTWQDFEMIVNVPNLERPHTAIWNHKYNSLGRTVCRVRPCGSEDAPHTNIFLLQTVSGQTENLTELHKIKRGFVSKETWWMKKAG